MRTLDRLLEMIQDSQWHSLVEIKKELSLPENILIELSRFLDEQDFIEKENHMLRILPKGLKFLEMPL